MGAFGAIKSYRDLLVWQKSIVFVKEIFHATRVFPQEEIYGLTRQVRRSAVSIASNIAEGFGRRTPGDFIRFLRIASGSLYEAQTQVIIAHELEFLATEVYNHLMSISTEIERMLNSLINKLERREGERKKK